MNPPRALPLSARRRLIDDFESTPVGKPPRDAVVSPGNETAAVAVTDELAATGKHCLKFTDAPGLKHAWLPHIRYAPNWSDDVAVLTVDLRLEPGAVFWHEWRDNANPYKVGPTVRIDADGAVTCGKRVVAHVPISAWFRLEIECGLGAKATGHWQLTITVSGQSPQRALDLPCGTGAWKKLDWLGFISDADATTAFYLDNLKLELR